MMLPVVVLISLGIVLQLCPIEAGQVCSKCSLSTTEQEFCDEEDDVNTLDCGTVYGDELSAFCVNMFSEGQNHKPSMRMCFSELALKRFLNKPELEDGCYSVQLTTGAWQVCLCQGDNHCNKYNSTEMGQIAHLKKTKQISELDNLKRKFEDRYQQGQSKIKETKKARWQQQIGGGIRPLVEKIVEKVEEKRGNDRETDKDKNDKAIRKEDSDADTKTNHH